MQILFGGNSPFLWTNLKGDTGVDFHSCPIPLSQKYSCPELFPRQNKKYPVPSQFQKTARATPKSSMNSISQEHSQTTIMAEADSDSQHSLQTLICSYSPAYWLHTPASHFSHTKDYKSTLTPVAKQSCIILLVDLSKPCLLCSSVTIVRYLWFLYLVLIIILPVIFCDVLIAQPCVCLPTLNWAYRFGFVYMLYWTSFTYESDCVWQHHPAPY